MPINKIAKKAIHIILTLLLQKPSKMLKVEGHLKALERQLKLCGKGDNNELVNESNTIQGRFPSTNTSMNTEKV